MTLKTQSLKAAMSFLFALMFVLAATVPASAQHQQPANTQQADTSRGMMQSGMMDMMQGGMMEGDMMGMMHQQMQKMEQMMKEPLTRSAMLVHMLPTMKEPLSLSDDQVARLKKSAQQFNMQKEAHQKQMKQTNEQLQKLLAVEDAAPDRVRALLEESATHHAQMQALAYEMASQMKGMLSAEQRTKLSEMTPMQMHHHMMSNMTMMQMMQAMHGDMMPGGMKGMMQDGMMH
jgi:hypothetical protein